MRNLVTDKGIGGCTACLRQEVMVVCFPTADPLGRSWGWTAALCQKCLNVLLEELNVATKGFAEQVEQGNTYVSEAKWRDILLRAFPDAVEIIQVSDKKEDKRGRDWLVVYLSGTSTRVQVKAQSPRYDDFVIEYLANDKTNTPGWINLDPGIDYIAYAIPLRRTVYLLPWGLLKHAWRQHGTRWIQKGEQTQDGFRIAKCRQTWGGVTHSVVVPVEELRKDMLLLTLWAVPMEEEG